MTKLFFCSGDFFPIEEDKMIGKAGSVIVLEANSH